MKGGFLLGTSTTTSGAGGGGWLSGSRSNNNNGSNNMSLGPLKDDRNLRKSTSWLQSTKTNNDCGNRSASAWGSNRQEGHGFYRTNAWSNQNQQQIGLGEAPKAWKLPSEKQDVTMTDSNSNSNGITPVQHNLPSSSHYNVGTNRANIASSSGGSFMPSSKSKKSPGPGGASSSISWLQNAGTAPKKPKIAHHSDSSSPPGIYNPVTGRSNPAPDAVMTNNAQSQRYPAFDQLPSSPSHLMQSRPPPHLMQPSVIPKPIATTAAMIQPAATLPEPIPASTMMQLTKSSSTSSISDSRTAAANGDANGKANNASSTMKDSNPYKNVPTAPHKSHGVPKTALYTYYGKRYRKQLNNEDYHVWDNGAKPHELRFTAVFVCPMTGEVFACGPYGDDQYYCFNTSSHVKEENQTQTTTTIITRTYWYTKKALAEHGAASRAYDCMMYRDAHAKHQQLLSINGPGAANPSEEELNYAKIGKEEPYLGPEDAPYLVTDVIPLPIQEKIRRTQEEIQLKNQLSSGGSGSGNGPNGSNTNSSAAVDTNAAAPQRASRSATTQQQEFAWENNASRNSLPPHHSPSPLNTTTTIQNRIISNTNNIPNDSMMI